MKECKRLDGCREVVAEGLMERQKAKQGRERDETKTVASVARKVGWILWKDNDKLRKVGK